VPNSGDGTVSVIDTATNRVTTTVSVGGSPSAIAVGRTRAYVLGNFGDDNLLTIEVVSNHVVGRLPIVSPSAVATDRIGQRAYVTAFPRNLVVVDGDRNVVIDTVTLSQENAAGVAATPDGKRVYAANTFEGTERAPCSALVHFFCDIALSEVDTVTGREIHRIPLGDQLSGVAVNGDGSRVYVTYKSVVGGNLYGSLAVLAPGGLVLKQISSPLIPPVAVAANPNGSVVWVAGGDSLVAVDPETGTVSPVVTNGGGLFTGVSVTPAGRRVYVVNALGSVLAIDTATRQIIATISVGNAPHAFGQFITPDAATNACLGDCNGDASVSIDEVVMCVNVALGNQSINACSACTCSGCETTVADIVMAVNNALGGC
jgi:YVTN family beta-propeller protein